MERHIFDFNQPQGTMSLMNLRNALRGLFQGDFMPLRPRASMILDDMEYPSDAAAQAIWSGTGVTVSYSTTKQEGNYALQYVIDGTGDRKVSKTQALVLSSFGRIKIWERCSATSSAIKFYLRDSSGNESYWDITTNGTANTWQQDDLDLTTPDSNNGTDADLSNITEWGFLGLDASTTYIFDTVKVICGLNVAVEAGLIAGFYQQVYVGQSRISFNGASSPAITPPSSNPRIDLLVMNSSGSLFWVTGSEAASPSEPAFPSDKIPICLVYCKTTMTKVVDYEDKDSNPNEAYIYKDIRPFLNLILGTLLQLTDTPSSYSGQANKTLKVKGDESGIEFVAVTDSDEKVKSRSDDSPAGYLDAKVDDATLEVDSVTKKMRVKDKGLNANKIIDHSAAITNRLTPVALNCDSELYTNDPSPRKVKEILLARGGTYRIKMDLKSLSARGRVYRNGIAIGTEQVGDSNSEYTTFSQDISGWSP